MLSHVKLLKENLNAGSCVIFVRHAEKFIASNFKNDAEQLCTPEGLARAESVGREIRQLICPDQVEIISSPTPRCQQTAEAFSKGFNPGNAEKRAESIKLLPDVGHNGIYVEDETVAIKHFLNNPSPISVFNEILQKKYLPGVANPNLATANLLVELLDIQQRDSNSNSGLKKLKVVFTHDSVLALFTGTLLNVSNFHNENWFNYLESVAVHARNEHVIFFWKEQQFNVSSRVHELINFVVSEEVPTHISVYTLTFNRCYRLPLALASVQVAASNIKSVRNDVSVSHVVVANNCSQFASFSPYFRIVYNDISFQYAAHENIINDEQTTVSGGIAREINKIINCSFDNDLVCLLDDDNCWRKDHLSKLYSCLTKTVSAAYSHRQIVNDDGSNFRPTFFPWVRGDPGDRLLQIFLNEGIFSRDSSIVRDSHISNENRGPTVDTGEWLAKRKVFISIPFLTTTTKEDEEAGEFKDVEFARKVAKFYNVDSSLEPSLVYRLGGYTTTSNTRTAERERVNDVLTFYDYMDLDSKEKNVYIYRHLLLVEGFFRWKTDFSFPNEWNFDSVANLLSEVLNGPLNAVQESWWSNEEEYNKFVTKCSSVQYEIIVHVFFGPFQWSFVPGSHVYTTLKKDLKVMVDVGEALVFWKSTNYLPLFESGNNSILSIACEKK